MEGTHQEMAAIRMRGRGGPSPLICPALYYGLTGLLLHPVLKLVAITASQIVPKEVHHVKRKICKDD